MKYLILSLTLMCASVSSADSSHRRTSETAKVLGAVESLSEYKSWVSNLEDNCKLESPSVVQVSHATGNHGNNEQYIVVRKSICPVYNGAQIRTSSVAYVVNMWVPHNDIQDSNVEGIASIPGIE